MQYSGGKEKIARRIADLLQPYIDERGAYCEPFLGGASVFSRISAQVKYGSDANAWLMCMWHAVQDGWEPPDFVSEDTYIDLKARKPMEPITAFVGFGCSFGGKWFGGYARRARDANFAGAAKRSLLRKIRGFGGAVLSCGSYADIRVPDGAVIYCDPPYAGTLGYAATGSFDSATFWQWCRNAELAGHPVFVSEYKAPDDFRVVGELPKKVTMSKANGYRDQGEKLFRWTGAK